MRPDNNNKNLNIDLNSVTTRLDLKEKMKNIAIQLQQNQSLYQIYYNQETTEFTLKKVARYSLTDEYAMLLSFWDHF